MNTQTAQTATVATVATKLAAARTPSAPQTSRGTRCASALLGVLATTALCTTLLLGFDNLADAPLLAVKASTVVLA